MSKISVEPIELGVDSDIYLNILDVVILIVGASRWKSGAWTKACRYVKSHSGACLITKKDIKNRKYVEKMHAGESTTIAWDKTTFLDLAKIVAYDKLLRCDKFWVRFFNVFGIGVFCLYCVIIVVNCVAWIGDRNVNVSEIWIIVSFFVLVFALYLLNLTPIVTNTEYKQKPFSKAL